jgi:hypothetical protein
VAQHFNEQVALSFDETLIQDFFREAELSCCFVAVLLLSMLLTKGKLRLCIDRPQWDAGTCRVHVFTISARLKSVFKPSKSGVEHRSGKDPFERLPKAQKAGGNGAYDF